MRLRLIKHLILLLLFCSFLKPAAAAPNLLNQVVEFKLSNGMKFLLLKREGAPVFSAYITVKVGGVDEKDGQTGIAHLLEHMAFKGTSTIGTKNYAEEKILLERIEALHQKWLEAKPADQPALHQQFEALVLQAKSLVEKEEFSQILLRNGGTNLNATTSQDLTNYFVTLPNTKLQLWAFLESERLKDPVFRDFYSEQNVVLEERRMRVEDSPFGKLYEAFIQNAFDKSPYRRPTIGYSQDIQKLSATNLKDFYKKYYVPENMVGTLVGNFSIPEAKATLEKYFGQLPAGKVPEFNPPSEPEPTQSKSIAISMNASPSMILGYLKPSLPHEDDYTFDVLQQILCEGRTGRLYKRLVEQERKVEKVSCSSSIPGARISNLFFVYFTLLPGQDPQAVLKIFNEELQKIAQNGVPKAELDSAKKNLLSQWYFEIQSNDDMAQTLGYFESIAGSWKYVLQHSKKIATVTESDLKHIIERYLKPERLRLGILNSEQKAKTP